MNASLKFKISQVLLVFFISINAYAEAPVILFTDIISGPDVGIGDSLGSGVIVTVWGQNLGSTQGLSTLTFTDSLNVEREPYIYYWKNADGELPGGPANLYESHNMQEIAFSIPDSADGVGSIKVTVDGAVSTLQFTVSNVGSIYWVAPGGNNNNACSYASPCEYINGDIDGGASGGIGNAKLSAGDTVYSKGVAEPVLSGSGRDVGMFVRSTNGTKDNPVSFIAYPGTRPTVIASDQGMVPYLSSYLNLSKFYMEVGHVNPALSPNAGISNLSDYHIKITKGRYIGNYLGQISGTCMTGWSGSITNQDDGGEGARLFGNEIADTGCPNSSRFQHTVYISVRNEQYSLTDGWDFSYNYLHGNYPNYGIHFYDETYNGDCGTIAGEIKVTHNLVTDQWGSGINIQTGDLSGTKNICWGADIILEDNILINVGLGEALESGVVPKPAAIRVKGDIGPSLISIKNNTMYKWGGASAIEHNGKSPCMDISHHDSVNPVISVQNNICNSDDDYPYIVTDKTIDNTQNNLFYTLAANPVNDTKPAWIGNIVTNPLIDVTGVKLSITVGSPAIDAAYSNPSNTHGFYGNPRSDLDIGATEFSIKPNPPTGLIVN